MINGKAQIQGTTQLQPWQVALFGGLRTRDTPNLELDGWVSLTCEDDTQEVVRAVRQEIFDSIVWLSIASSFDKIATGMVARSKALCTILGQIFTKQEVDQDTVDFLKAWKMPEIGEDESIIQAPGDDRDEVYEALKAKKKTELKVMLKEMEMMVSGTKRVLIERLCDYWYPIPEEEPLDGEPYEGKVGDEVSAVCPDDDQWYPGVIESIGEDEEGSAVFTVKWDDPEGGPESHEVVATRVREPGEEEEGAEEEEEEAE